MRLFTKKKDTPHRPTRHWKCHRFNGDRLFRLRSSLLVFGAIMIYDSEAYLFADSVSSDTRSQITKAFLRSYLVLHFLWSWIEWHTPEYPPNGWILHCVFITMICGITFSIIVRGYVRMLYLKWTNYTLDSSTPHDNGGATFQSSPVSFTTITTAFSTKDAVSTHIQGRVSFDSDLIQFVLDNCANVHIINDRELFESIVATSMSGVATIGGDPLTPQGQGSCHIYIKDDSGKVVPLTLHNALYFPDSPVNIISISRLADSYDDDEGTFVKTTRFQSEFSWDFGKHFKTISHGESRIPEINVSTASDGWTTFYTFSNMLQRSLYISSVFNATTCVPCDNSDSPTNAPAVYVSDDESVASTTSPVEVSSPSHDEGIDPPIDEPTIGPYASWQPGDKLTYFRDGHSDNVVVEKLIIADDNLSIKYSIRLSDGRTIESTKEFLRDQDDDDIFSFPQTLEEYRSKASELEPADLHKIMHPVTLTPLEQEFMDSHHCLQHISYIDMFRMAEYGHLPKRFLKIKKNPPMCPSCIFASMKRKAWKRKSERSTTVRKLEHNRPGKGTSADQLISAQPGLVPRISGKHTRQRITAATCFLDHYSDFSYTHLCTSTTQEATLEAKAAYEKLAASHGVQIKSYHADNGRFAEKGFRDAVHDANQTISFCAVNAHHQNGLIEKFIQDLTRGARTLLLHAKRHWPEAIGTILWPFALKAFEDRRNHWHLDANGKSPLQKFSNVYHTQDIKQWHTFGCPVFVLEDKAANGVIPKWDPRSRVGIYLGHSPCRAGSVALVLNPKTLHVSPQYHVVFDDQFTTVPFMKNGEIPPHWEELVTHNTESVTDKKIDIANTWAAALTPDMIEDTPFSEDVNLQLSRSFNPTDILPKDPSGRPLTIGVQDSEGDVKDYEGDTSQEPSLVYHDIKD